jgi:hypothetical protein
MIKRTNEDISLKEAIEEFLNSNKFHKFSQKLFEYRIIHGWKTIMGSYIMQYTTELYIKDRILYVRLNSSSLRHELSMEKTKIIDLLNKEAQKDFIRNIIFL